MSTQLFTGSNYLTPFSSTTLGPISLSLFSKQPSFSSASSKALLCAEGFFCGPQKVPFLPNSQIIHPSSQCVKSSCDELCRCGHYGQIYYCLLLLHIWWEGIWEMYECCNLLLATTKPVKLIKCGLLDVSTCHFHFQVHLWGPEPWSKRSNNVQMI